MLIYIFLLDVSCLIQITWFNLIKGEKYLNVIHTVYPGLHLPSYLQRPSISIDSNEKLIQNDGKQRFVSINRFERKKNIQLAIHAFAKMRSELATSNERQHIQLVIAGGYDPMNIENKEYLKELSLLTKKIRFK